METAEEHLRLARKNFDELRSPEHQDALQVAINEHTECCREFAVTVNITEVGP